MVETVSSMFNLLFNQASVLVQMGITYVGGYSSHERILNNELSILYILTIFPMKSRDISLLLPGKTTVLETVANYLSLDFIYSKGLPRPYSTILVEYKLCS